jgi:hypothetical protein
VIQPSFRTLLIEALRDFAKRGYRSEGDLQEWLLRLHEALDRELFIDEPTRVALAAALERVFNREVTRGHVGERVSTVGRYTLERLAPELRAELDRRIFAGVDLIRLNRVAAQQKTLQRFAGWVSSIPAAGAGKVNVRDVAREIQKPVKQLKYEARRVAIDQGHKLSAAIAHVAASEARAIGAVWHDRGEFDHGYDARPEHLARSGQLFLLRGSWALNDGLIRKGGLHYSDEVEQPAMLPFCSCFWEYVVTPRDLPADLLTEKGRLWLQSA